MEKRKNLLVILLFVLVVSSVVFAADVTIPTCKPEWEDNVHIRVLDAGGAPLPGALVQATYQVSATITNGVTGGYTTTLPLKTDQNGFVTIHMQNQESNKDRVNCQFTVLVQYDASFNRSIWIAQNHPNPIEITLPVEKVQFTIDNQNGDPIPNATISVRNITVKTDAQGSAMMLLSKGKVIAYVVYPGGGSVAKNIDVEYYGQRINIQVPLYSFYLRVVNDEGQAVPALVKVDNSYYSVGKNGSLLIKKIADPNPDVEVIYKGHRQKISVHLDQKQDYAVIYDFRAPKIETPKVVLKNGDVYLYFNVVDPGEDASGVAPQGVEVTCKNSQGITNTITPFVSPSGQLIADLGTPSLGVWKISITATDNTGNMETMEGVFTINQTNKINQNSNQTNEQQSTNSQSKKSGGIPTIMLILGVGLVIVVLLIIGYYLYDQGYF